MESWHLNYILIFPSHYMCYLFQWLLLLEVFMWFVLLGKALCNFFFIMCAINFSHFFPILRTSTFLFPFFKDFFVVFTLCPGNPNPVFVDSHWHYLHFSLHLWDCSGNIKVKLKWLHVIFGNHNSSCSLSSRTTGMVN